uniref:C-X-C motif chemokine 16 n=1 Tax=Neovison vison TaxID=452646 RepID=A0A8C7C1Y0_NEOVI
MVTGLGTVVAPGNDKQEAGDQGQEGAFFPLLIVHGEPLERGTCADHLGRPRPPGHGNEGSVIGSCYCHRRISSHSPPKGEVMAHFRKHLRAYDRCNFYIRFQLHSRSVCGGSKDTWVQELVSCHCPLVYSSGISFPCCNIKSTTHCDTLDKLCA